MIQEFVEAWDNHKNEIREQFSEHAGSYEKIVNMVVKMLNKHCDEQPNPEKITVIDHGHYQGTMLFIIPEDSYQPSLYWYVQVSYGSCSCCDTLQSIDNYSSESPTEQQVEDYMTLALHIIQNIKKISKEII